MLRKILLAITAAATFSQFSFAMEQNKSPYSNYVPNDWENVHKPVDQTKEYTQNTTQKECPPTRPAPEIPGKSYKDIKQFEKYEKPTGD